MLSRRDRQQNYGRSRGAAQTITHTEDLLPYQDARYRFQIIPIEATPPSGREQPLFVESGFQAGRGAFGSGGDCPLQSTVHTMWPINTQLLARSIVKILPGATNVQIRVAVDNDVVGIFFDGQALTSYISHDECPNEDDLRFDVPPHLATEGDKIVAFHLLDRGSESFFDARIVADVTLQVLAAAQCKGNTVIDIPCTQLADYVRTCGVQCPYGGTVRQCEVVGGITKGPSTNYRIDFW